MTAHLPSAGEYRLQATPGALLPGGDDCPTSAGAGSDASNASGVGAVAADPGLDVPRRRRRRSMIAFVAANGTPSSRWFTNPLVRLGRGGRGGARSGGGVDVDVIVGEHALERRRHRHPGAHAGRRRIDAGPHQQRLQQRRVVEGVSAAVGRTEDRPASTNGETRIVGTRTPRRSKLNPEVPRCDPGLIVFGGGRWS